MSLLNFAHLEEIKARRTIKDADIERFRRDLYASAFIGQRDIDGLLALNVACPIQVPAWPDLFIEVVGDYILNQVEPQGYLTVQNAEWLTGRLATEGRIVRKVELELLITVLEKARWAPAALSAFAMSQVKLAILLGDGPIRATCRAEVGTVQEIEVDLLRRILEAYGGDDEIALTRAEAEILLEIDEVTQRRANHSSWDDFFVKALAGAIMAASGYRSPPRGEALRRDHWLDRRNDSELRFVTMSPATAGLARVLAGYRSQSLEQKALTRLEQQRREIITSERIIENEPLWLVDRLANDAGLTPNMQALLAFLKSERPAVHPVLRPLLDRADRAA